MDAAEEAITISVFCVAKQTPYAFMIFAIVMIS
jgi:hypothetical protein